ncbi:TPR-like protein [Melanogaster broomeanus]|nr:TPR-like protein [Melanogaster broomeanus]
MGTVGSNSYALATFSPCWIGNWLSTTLRWVIELVHPGPHSFTVLANAFAARFEYTGDMSDINHAISARRQAVLATPDGHANMPACLMNLGHSYLTRFESSGELPDIDNAIATLQQAVDLAPDDYPYKPACLTNLGHAFLSRFRYRGELADIESAISTQKSAVSLSPDNNEYNKLACLVNLGNSFLERFKHSGMIEDIDEAISVLQDASRLMSGDHACMPTCMTTLGSSFSKRFERLGELLDINNAISAHQQAIKIAPDNHPEKPWYLTNLGNSLVRRFERLGDLADVDGAISAHQQAVQLTPEGHPNLPGRFGNLGNSFQARFDHFDNVSDINGAVAAHWQAAELTPHDHVYKAPYLSNLGNSLVRRFELLKEPDDIDNAISVQQLAVELTQDDHPNQPGCLSNLGSHFLCQFEHSGNIADIDSAISTLQRAVELAPDGHAYKPACLNQLGKSLFCRFDHRGYIPDLDDAISAQERALALLHDGHAYRPACLADLGNSLQARFKRLGNTADMTAGLLALRSAATASSGPPSLLLSSARTWAFAVNEAAAAAIGEGNIELALEWLEEGRCVVWGQILRLRTPVDELRRVAPKLADELQNVSLLLEQAGMVGSAPPLEGGDISMDMLREEKSQKHHALARRYDELIVEARGLPGFGNFLRPKRFSSLRNAAKSGPVVVLNVDESRCDALILPSPVGTLVHVPLDRLSYVMARTMRSTFLQSLRDHNVLARGTFPVLGEGRHSIKYVLETLWERVVEPVLSKLNMVTTPNLNGTPRVTWCGTGPLAFLPFHAAGIYNSSKQYRPKIFHLVVSAYTPTLSTLLVNEECSIPDSNRRILIVSQPATPGQQPLPGTMTEVLAIRKSICEMESTWLNDTKATKDAVIQAMENHSWAHLACHAVQNSKDPTKSTFQLVDGPLQLADIMKKSFKHAELAVLSACQTASGDEKLPEEAVHLAAGMLMAGYKSVIATMWSIGDSDAPVVVEELYRYLAQEAGGDSSKAAYALHSGVKRLREKVGEEEFVKWVPFVHYGL